MRQREDGACYAFSKSDGNAYAFPRSEHARLLRDWQAGLAFYTGPMFHGGTITLKLNDICAISDSPAEAMRLRREDDDADRAEDALSG